MYEEFYLLISLYFGHSDGAHGLLLRGAGSDAVLPGHASPIHGCCLCGLCSAVHFKEEPNVDRNARAPHWILWYPVAVSLFRESIMSAVQSGFQN